MIARSNPVDRPGHDDLSSLPSARHPNPRADTSPCGQPDNSGNGRGAAFGVTQERIDELQRIADASRGRAGHTVDLYRLRMARHAALAVRHG